MNNLYAMQRANGDWFALENNGHLRMPVFQSSSEAKIARSRDSTMECFRPAVLDTHAIEKIKATDGNSASFLIVSDPSRNLKRGRLLGFTELTLLLVDLEKTNQSKS
jgi:hypothetical protein